MASKYDLNVWDKLGYETEYEQEGWVIQVYEYADNYTKIDVVVDELALSLSEVRALTLGVAEEDGGDYAPDADFWIEPGAFLEIYKAIPERVRDFVERYEVYVGEEELV